MVKRIVLAIVAVFVVWSVLDFLLHSVLCGAIYEATAELWRPMDEMNMPLMHSVTLVRAVCLVLIYALLVGQKSLAAGLKFGLLFGLAGGFAMGFGSYSYMPIPVSLAWSWFAGSTVQAIIAGALTAAIVRPPKAKS